MKELASVQEIPQMNYIGMWSTKIPQSSIDHLSRVLMRRTKQSVALRRIGRHCYVFIAGDLKTACEHFDMISPRHT